MAKTRLQFRIDKGKKEALLSICKVEGIKVSEKLNKCINEIINYESNGIAKDRIKKVIRELKEPFVFVRSKTGIDRAKREREIREAVTKKLTEAFKIDTNL